MENTFLLKENHFKVNLGYFSFFFLNLKNKILKRVVETLMNIYLENLTEFKLNVNLVRYF